MVPYDHARLHAAKFGGKPEDYLPVDEFLDSTKAHIPSFQHRAVLHNSWGMILAEQVLGPVIVNSDGKTIAVREIARQHIIQDCGVVPTLKEAIFALIEDGGRRYNRPQKELLDRLEDEQRPVEAVS